MAGLYVHIPFCRKACHYCNFHFSTSQKLRQAYADALIKEVRLKKEKIRQFPLEAGFEAGIKTVYFGGGTPSQLHPDELGQIVDVLQKHFEWDKNVEFTIEANPDDLSAGVLKAYKNMGVNRLSIGIQSFREEDLMYLGRLHDARQADYAIKLSQDMGFENLNIDLIYGLPTQSDSDWEGNLDLFFKWEIPHLSAYCLTVELHTPLHVLIKKNKKEDVSESKAVRHFDILMDKARKQQFLHYEISNFCRENYHSRHNLSYWQQKPYLGFGASAHSYYTDTRTWNIANTAAYIKNITEGEPFCEEEQLDLQTKYNEYILTSLRTMWGCDRALVRSRFGNRFYDYLKNQSDRHIEQGNLIAENDFLILTDKGKLFADGIASDLFMVD